MTQTAPVLIVDTTAASGLVLKGEQVEATPGSDPSVPGDDAVARLRKRLPDGREHSDRCCRK